MKVKIVSLITMVATFNCYADVVFFNKNKYDIEVSYSICDWDNIAYTHSCSSITKITVSGLSKYPEKNFKYVAASQPIIEHGHNIVITEVVEKNEKGNVVAIFDKCVGYPESNPCGHSLDIDATQKEKNGDIYGINMNYGAVFDDMNQSPYITIQNLPFKNWSRTKIN